MVYLTVCFTGALRIPFSLCLYSTLYTMSMITCDHTWNSWIVIWLLNYVQPIYVCDFPIRFREWTCVATDHNNRSFIRSLVRFSHSCPFAWFDIQKLTLTLQVCLHLEANFLLFVKLSSLKNISIYLKCN